MEEEVNLCIEKKLAEPKESMKEELLRDMASQIQAGRIHLPYSGGISSEPGMQSRIQSGLSNATSPPPPHVDVSATPGGDHPDVLVSEIATPDLEVIPSTADPLLLSQFDGAKGV